jgi:hypothetical protein
MSRRLHAIALALATLLLCATAPAADAAAPRVAVHERVLVLPALPADADVPVNLPEKGAVRLPFVTGGAPGVAARINAIVWREMLDDAVAPTAPGPSWTPPRDKLPQGTSSLGFTAALLPAADPRLLSLTFRGDGCGAYCEEFTITDVFDLRDGHKIVLGDLLTIDGFAAVGRRVDAERRRAYQAQVREWRAVLNATPARGSDAAEDAADRLALDETCLKEVDSQPSTPARLADNVFAPDGRGGVVLSLGRCSNHATLALDDVGELAVAIPAAALDAALSPYGLAVVRQVGDAPAPPDSFTGRELHGRLAGMPITMTLEPSRDGADARGTYQYDRFHAPIALTVRSDGGTLRAVEQAGEFSLNATGGTLVGTWRDASHRKALPVILR